MNIATVSRDLRAQKRYEADLRHLNETLENRVSTRTAELADANEKLVAGMAERQRTDLRLQQLQRELFHAGRLSLAGQMAAALAHELNQPLTAATNSVHAARRLLAKGGREKLSTVGEIMDEAAAQTLRAGEIIRRLRDFVAQRQTERRFEDVPDLIEEASALALTGSGALGIELHYEFDPNAAKVFADRIQIQQVLVNLIRNSMEAMATTGRRELRIATASLEGGAIEIAVADSGVGLSKAVSGQLFTPFISTKRDGMGLGLLICRSIVEAHGGTLVGEPNPERGATFRFMLAARPNGESDAG
jgi:C4-dicarboxylate-specific signal transduction histidine kinase